MIPPFGSNGYLPEGLYLCTEEEIEIRFGSANARRRRLMDRIRKWISLARSVSARRLLIDGSFVTAKAEPDDVDAVMELTLEFYRQARQGTDSALELMEMFTTRKPEELFAAEDGKDWVEWVEFFGRTRESNSVRKGLVEISL